MELVAIVFAMIMTLLVAGTALVFWVLFGPFSGFCVIGLWVLLCVLLLRSKQAGAKLGPDQLNAFQQALADPSVKDSENPPKA